MIDTNDTYHVEAGQEVVWRPPDDNGRTTKQMCSG